MALESSPESPQPLRAVVAALKGWVERTETGQMAITAVGVDQVEQDRLRVGKDHMLMTGDLAPEEPVPADLHLPPRDAD